MGIFTRVKDIINSNINAMLSKAEDPEKLLKLMIQEMEDTLVEVKSSCAGAIAAQKKLGRQVEQVAGKADQWADRARLAIDKGREDLAREALVEKKRFRERTDLLEKECLEAEEIVRHYQNDIVLLEEKVARARDKQRVLVQRHIRAEKKKQTQLGIRKIDSSDAMVRIDQFENRIERMEAEADLINGHRKPVIEDEFAKLDVDEEIERELEALKKAAAKKPAAASN